ncbi:hypothetical protein B7R87_26855 [Streptomyces tsukubensis]|uniref:Uncharacterized protein n=1 Tax=Streptomyces tsukubensis (strain DSM 42081 / NBRC 108919 / NRRL 18488 / 9993) TaxID=1114943 RepID=A0A7G3U9E4_STRT9|nr:hypothetical protein [Streptomyces tsukubensis]AZK97082.1 hypothetical protein B7R87_26855 [Streptomyces tsukubensis]QKM66947.1 hypothetical protein STSU_006915 [Streptomyces tsukubensis NRRL18488]TAI41576.1 hypothetical protein EWI31_27535 [Streptomyces tsukubensis]
MSPRDPRRAPVTAAEAGAWADTLVHHGLLHAAVHVPTGQWLVQRTPTAPVRVLAGPVDVLHLAAQLQAHARTRGSRIR